MPAFALYYLQCTFTVFTTAASPRLKGSKVQVISRKDKKMKRGQVVWFVPNLYLPYKETLLQSSKEQRGYMGNDSGEEEGRRK